MRLVAKQPLDGRPRRSTPFSAHRHVWRHYTEAWRHLQVFHRVDLRVHAQSEALRVKGVRLRSFCGSGLLTPHSGTISESLTVCECALHLTFRFDIWPASHVGFDTVVHRRPRRRCTIEKVGSKRPGAWDQLGANMPRLCRALAVAPLIIPTEYQGRTMHEETWTTCGFLASGRADFLWRVVMPALRSGVCAHDVPSSMDGQFLETSVSSRDFCASCVTYKIACRLSIGSLFCVIFRHMINITLGRRYKYPHFASVHSLKFSSATSTQ